VETRDVREVIAAVVGGLVGEGNGAPVGGPDNVPAADGEPAPPRRPAGGLAEIAVGSDHAGFLLKQRIAADLLEHGFTVHDCGPEAPDPVDYPDYAHAVARLVADGDCRWGIVIDGAGIGSAIAANKVPGVRAATCWDVSSARNSREHNHANVLALGAGFLGEALALQVVQAWLSTPWAGGRHARRVAKITEIERRSAREVAA